MIGKNIKRLRISLKMSIRKLAELAEVSKTTINEIENDIVTNPQIETLLKIANVLNVPIGLVTGKTDTIEELSKDIYDIAEFNNIDISEAEKRNIIKEILIKEPEIVYEVNHAYIGPLKPDEYAALNTYLKIYRTNKGE